MVRVIVGTLLDVGAGRREPAEVADMLAARDRRVAGFTAPAQGLALVEVVYPDFSSRSGGATLVPAFAAATRRSD
jgi:tRNA pseudouridine38-40 synthase